MGYFEGKVFLVTGASSGIGKAIAEHLAERGARVVAMARSREALEALAAAHPAYIRVFVGDVTEETACREAIAQAHEAFGRLDGLVHSAGVSMRGCIGDAKLTVFRRVMEVNYFAAIRLIQLALPDLEASRGHVVVISSLMGKVSIPKYGGYAATKHAVQALLDALRIEVHDAGVHVLAVCPGYVRTNISANTLCGDGSVYGRTGRTTAAGLDPSHVAKQTLAAIERRQREVSPARWPETLGVALGRLAPALGDRVLLLGQKRI